MHIKDGWVRVGSGIISATVQITLSSPETDPHTQGEGQVHLLFLSARPTFLTRNQIACLPLCHINNYTGPPPYRHI